MQCLNYYDQTTDVEIMMLTDVEFTTERLEKNQSASAFPDSSWK